MSSSERWNLNDIFEGGLLHKPCLALYLQNLCHLQIEESENLSLKTKWWLLIKNGWFTAMSDQPSGWISLQLVDACVSGDVDVWLFIFSKAVTDACILSPTPNNDGRFCFIFIILPKILLFKSRTLSPWIERFYFLVEIKYSEIRTLVIMKKILISINDPQFFSDLGFWA